ncbi:MAG: apolipoprotein N-acyltransferase [Bryobacteraceae bacterium]
MLNLLLAIASGLLLAAIHPRWNLVFLAPLALTPLLIALSREYRPKFRFLLGYAAGAVFWGSMCYWIQFVMAVHGGLGNLGGLGVFLLFCLTPSLNMAVFGMLAGVVIHKWYAGPAIAALWVAAERIPTPFGFMWLKLGDAGVDMSIPLRLAPITGVYGISFLFALMSVAIAMIALRRTRRDLLWILMLPVLYLLPALPEAGRPDESAVTLQPNLDEEKEWQEQEVREMQRRLEYLSLQNALASGEPSPQLILWPEVPAPLYYDRDAQFRERMNSLARLTRTPVLFGTVARTGKGEPLNSVQMVDAAGETAGRYDKILLVPFGEYVPTPFSFANKISSEIGNFQAGEKFTTFSIGGHSVGTFICYESAFPHFVRRFQTDVLINLSNDGYFGHSAAREQHLGLVRMRAAENARWIVRVTNNGISTAADPAGRVTRPLPEFSEAVGRLGYAYHKNLTFYSRYGDWFAWLCLCISAVTLFASQVPNRVESPVRRRP